MKISALVAEFNPFHSGHKHLVDAMRKENDAVIAIMSPNFVQRGECALFSKEERCAAAIKNGVDMVLELPTVYALSSAEGFAYGGVEILSHTGIVDELWFGSELGELSPLVQCAEILNEETDEFRQILTEKLAEGLNFPAAREFAVSLLCGKQNILNSPNNILAVEYIRILKKLSSPIKPVTIKRIGSGYNDTTLGEFSSASAIRAALKENQKVSEHMLYNYEGKPVFMHSFDSIIAARLKTIPKEELCLIPDCNEEISVRLKAASSYNTFDEILAAASCKCYTQSRLRRILCNMVIGNSFATVPHPTYIRPLAFNETGGKLLKKMKSTASLPVVSRGALLKNDDIFNLECRATDIYNLISGIEGGREFSLRVQTF